MDGPGSGTRKTLERMWLRIVLADKGCSSPIHREQPHSVFNEEKGNFCQLLCFTVPSEAKGAPLSCAAGCFVRYGRVYTNVSYIVRGRRHRSLHSIKLHPLITINNKKKAFILFYPRHLERAAGSQHRGRILERQGHSRSDSSPAFASGLCL